MVPVIGNASGAVKLATNVVKAINKADDITDTVKIVDKARDLGKIGEEASGIIKNTKHIDSLTGATRFRVPDGFDSKILTEVKNVKYQCLTSQIKDDLLYSQKNNLKFILQTRNDTKISKPLQSLINQGSITLKYIGK